MPTFGVDVSKHQGRRLDWRAIRASGIEFMIARASLATTPDPTYRANVERAVAAGLPVVGAYHFLYPARVVSPVAQARLFVRQIGDAAGHLAVLDVERDRNRTTGEVFAPTITDVRAFAAEFAELTGGHPLVLYAPGWYWRTIGNPAAADLGPLHASRYVPVTRDAAGRPRRMTPAEAYAKVPAAWWTARHGGWTTATILQFTSSGRVDGHGGRIDLNAFRGPIDSLAALTGSGAATTGMSRSGGDMRITRIKAEDWAPTVTGDRSNGVFRDAPERAAPVTHRVAPETVVRTIAEVRTSAPPPDHDWRLTEHDGKPAYLLRSDWTPVVPGGDPEVDEALTAFIEHR